MSSSPSPGYCWICSILRVPEHCKNTILLWRGNRASFFRSFHRKPRWLIDKTAFVEEVIVLVDDRDAAVIAHGMVLIPGQFGLYKPVLGPSVADQGFVRDT